MATIVRAVLPDWPLGPEQQEHVFCDVLHFVRRSIRAMPFHLRIAIELLSPILGIHLALVSRGNRARAAALRRFEKFGPGRATVRLYRSLAVLAYYEHPLVLGTMGIEDPHLRSERYREKRRAIASVS